MNDKMVRIINANTVEWDENCKELFVAIKSHFQRVQLRTSISVNHKLIQF